MAKSDYAEGRKKHLKEYAQRKKMPIGGSWKGKGEYDYILKFTKDKNSARSKQNKYEMVCEYNILDDVDTTKFKQKDMHGFAHHLNSSQILCYNFFRPYIDENGGATQGLVDLLAKQHIIIEKGANCTFEYEDDLGDETQFDFHIKSGETEVFFEIKYTENSFASYSKESSARTQYKERYVVQFGKQNCLVENPQDEDDFIKKAKNDYQLYRNALRITDENKYLVLLYPKGNGAVDNQAEKFVKNKIKDEYKDNIQRVFWEDIVDENTELHQKYFAE